MFAISVDVFTSGSKIILEKVISINLALRLVQKFIRAMVIRVAALKILQLYTNPRGASLDKKFKIFSMMLSLVFVFGCWKSNYEKYFKLVFVNSYSFKKITMPDGGFQMSYKVNLKYPSKDVFDFYDSYFKTEGWTRYSLFGPNQGNWEYLIYKDKTVPAKSKGEGGRFQLLYTWVDKNKSQEASLFLNYSDNYFLEGTPKIKRPFNDIQEVVFQVFPFHDVKFDQQLFLLKRTPSPK